MMVAYNPLTQARRLGDAAVKGIVEKHCKSAVQVVLRWTLQRRAEAPRQLGEPG
jgi:diketogulonate reductase-like aldo/keto reductase